MHYAVEARPVPAGALRKSNAVVAPLVPVVALRKLILKADAQAQTNLLHWKNLPCHGDSEVPVWEALHPWAWGLLVLL